MPDENFSTKDFRTWAATVLCGSFCSAGRSSDERAAKRQVNDAVAHVAQRLGNTAAVCRAAYVHPEIIAAYMSGALFRSRTRDAASLQAASSRRARRKTRERELAAFVADLRTIPALLE